MKITPTAIVEGTSIGLGIVTSGLIQYFANDPQLAAAIGALSYIAGRALGNYAPPGLALPTASITAAELQEALSAYADARAGSGAKLLADLEALVRSAQATPLVTSPPPPPPAA